MAEKRLIVVVEGTAGCLVQRSGWTKDGDIFLQLLSALSFDGGGFSEAAITVGLSEALMLLHKMVIKINKELIGKRHCILVAASNPPVQNLNLETGNLQYGVD